MGGEKQLLLGAETMDSPAILAPAATAAAAPPVDAPQSSGPPPFLTKTYEMVDDPSTHAIVSWSSANNSFVVWNPPEFAQELLPKYFKHNNFSSFVRQLNTYGFRKTDPDRWEFANEGFLRGRRDLLRTIHRRKPAAHPPQQQGACVDVGKLGLEAEIDKLKRDKNSLMLELVRMGQQQQNTERELQLTTHRLQVTEMRQQRMISFLAKAMQNTSFFAQFVSQQNEENHVMRKKRRLPVHEDEGDMDDSFSPESSMSAQSSDNQMVTFQRSGLGEDSARAMIYQMFFPAESPPGNDTNHFDCPMREMDVTPNSGGVNGFNRQSGVTLKEITTKFPDTYLSVPIVTDVSTVEVHECTPVAQPFDNTRPSGGNGSEDGSRYPHSEHRDSNETVEVDWHRDTVSHEAEVQSARTDTSRLDPSRSDTSRLDTSRLDTARADTGREDTARADTARADTATHNSGFWSQFLTEDPRPVADTASRQEREVQLETQNLFQDGKIAVQSSCPGTPGVDVLSHQLGQLAPG